MKELPEEISKIIKHWVQKAENDITSAQQIISLSENCPYDTICFHVQQCIEKYIKALLIRNKIEFPKTHDMKTLLRLVPSEYSLPLSTKEAEKLTDYAVASRYPVDDMEDPDRQEAYEAIMLAQKIREHIRNYLKIN